MHLSLYRKYRPKSFSDVVGQEHITKILQKEVEGGRVHHAYIFTGSRGTGKTTCAKILAKAINCENSQNGNPCLSCDICADIENGSVLDIVEIDAASNTGVDNIRDLKEEAMFTPARGKYRVFIIDEVHMLSSNAFNALLKILEEPPKHVVFILATTEVDEVLPTVLSRCQRFDFKRITGEKIAERLKFVANQEGFKISDDAAMLIAKISDGALRDALSILEQCSVYSNDITAETVAAAAGIAGREYITKVLGFVKNGELGPCLEVLSELYSGGKNLVNFIEELAVAFRDVMVLKCSGGNEELLNCMPDEVPFYKEYAATVSMDWCLEKLSVLKNGIDGVGKSFNDRVFSELMLVRLCKGAGVFEEKVPEAVKETKPAPKKVLEAKPEKKEEVKEEIKEEPKEEKREEPQKTAPMSFDKWNEVLINLSGKSPMLSSILSGSEAKCDSESVYVIPENEFFHTVIRKDNNAALLSAAIEEVSGKQYKLKVAAVKAKTKISPLEELARRAEEEGIKVNRED